MRWIWSVYFVLAVSCSANWTMPAFTNSQAWGTSITATGTVREHTQVITHCEGTNEPTTWTNLYWRFDSGAASNDYTETDAKTYTNLIVDVGIPDRTNTMLLRGRDAAMWELYLAQLERSEVLGIVPTSPAFWWHGDYVANLQARKDWIDDRILHTVAGYVCTTNAATNGTFDAWFAVNTNATTFPLWSVSNLLEHVDAPQNWLDYTPTWPTARVWTNMFTVSTTNDGIGTNSVWMNGGETNMIGTNGQVLTMVYTNADVLEGFCGLDYQRHDFARKMLDELVWTWSNATEHIYGSILDSGWQQIDNGSSFAGVKTQAEVSLHTNTIWCWDDQFVSPGAASLLRVTASDRRGGTTSRVASVAMYLGPSSVQTSSIPVTNCVYQRTYTPQEYENYIDFNFMYALTDPLSGDHIYAHTDDVEYFPTPGVTDTYTEFFRTNSTNFPPPMATNFPGWPAEPAEILNGTTQHWKIVRFQRPIVLQKWQFQYGPTNSP